jgi:hypothetical protein
MLSRPRIAGEDEAHRIGQVIVLLGVAGAAFAVALASRWPKARSLASTCLRSRTLHVTNSNGRGRRTEATNQKRRAVIATGDRASGGGWAARGTDATRICAMPREAIGSHPGQKKRAAGFNPASPACLRLQPHREDVAARGPELVEHVRAARQSGFASLLFPHHYLTDPLQMEQERALGSIRRLAEIFAQGSGLPARATFRDPDGTAAQGVSAWRTI